MENKENNLRNSLGTAYQGLVLHLEEVQKRKTAIAELLAENQRDKKGLEEILKKTVELNKELEK